MYLFYFLFKLQTKQIPKMKKYQFILRNVMNTNLKRKLSTSICDHHSLFGPEEYEQRHGNLVKLLQNHHSNYKNKLLLVPAAEKSFLADTVIPQIHYRQNADFTYLTGLNTLEAAGSVFAILIVNDQIQNRFLFTPTLLPRSIVWEGSGLRQPSYESRLKSLQIELSDFARMRQLVDQTGQELFLTKYWRNQSDLMQKYIGNRIATALSPYLDQLRIIKSENEMKAMRRTSTLAVNALNSTMNFGGNQMQNGINFVYENQLAAHFEYECRLHGSPRLSYPPVVGGSERAVTIHYGSNSERMSGDQWVLMDAGCEDPDGYVSDVTRCWPINRSPNKSSLHYALYQALCCVHQDLFKRVQVDQTSLNMLLHEQTRLLAILLKQFNIISKSADDRSVQEAVFAYCPHHVSHYLGLDVHDCSTFSRDAPLRKGMCFTIEPGIYFRHDHNIPEEFKGIGLRVEDDILINEHNQVENMTHHCHYFV